MQDLFLVLGGELRDLGGTEFRDPTNLHTVGVFTTRTQAHDAWKANAQRTVDNALMRYFVVPLNLEETERPFQIAMSLLEKAAS